MPRIAVKSVWTANNNPLPDSWEFFCLSKTGEVDGGGSNLPTISPQHKFD